MGTNGSIQHDISIQGYLVCCTLVSYHVCAQPRRFLESGVICILVKCQSFAKSWPERRMLQGGCRRRWGTTMLPGFVQDREMPTIEMNDEEGDVVIESCSNGGSSES